MTPETRAARDRLAAFLDAFAALPDDRKDPGVPSRIVAIATPEDRRACWELNEHDLRTVLAALDRHERATDPSTWREPCNIALSHTNGEITCQLAVADPLPAGYLESGGRYTGNRNHWEKHWHQDEHGQVRTWTDNESED